MTEEYFQITNRFGEKLEALMRKPSALGKYPAIILVSGLGMDLHEWNNSFDEISRLLVKQGYLTLQFSFSGCGNSQGKYVEMTFNRQARQIEDMLAHLQNRQNVNENKIGLVAQSCGVPSTLLVNTQIIISYIFISGAFDPYNELKRMFIKRNAFNPSGISKYPRSSGAITYFGKAFWQDLKKYNEQVLIRSINVPALVLHGDKDDYIPFVKAQSAFKFFPNSKSRFKLFRGADHGFEIPLAVREEFLREVVNWFQQTL